MSYAVCSGPIHYVGYGVPALGIMSAYLIAMDRVRTIKMEEQEILRLSHGKSLAPDQAGAPPS